MESKKIAITELLNPSNQENLKEKLQEINKQLISLCSSLPKRNWVPAPSSDILRSLSRTKLDSQEIRLIKTTYRLSTLLSKLQEKDIVFNVVTKDHLLKNGTPYNPYPQPYRGHRFTKENVHTLEAWYSNHIDNPYLDPKSLQSLAQKTNLSKIQIKNWVSNRRRKQKHPPFLLI
uniref:Mating-type protein ALPHA2 n=1 Tax=Nakaseomyces delphensis TaxID=51657 RepID=MTAL2_NAKDE|nr:RecName: Full=Mating-type protein ALPHA2 [Nakaseomyces delphensis]AAO25604.1 ALPHA2 [Nakaseomyces delphensis]